MNRQKAIVIGGSMAGLLAARVLSNHFEEVVLLERDNLQERAIPRKGVPQGNHIHILLKRGMDIVEGFFPGLFDDLVAEGAVPMDLCRDLKQYHLGNWRVPMDHGDIVYSVTRPRLEWHVRQRVLAIPNVNVMTGVSVTGYDRTDTTITGVFFRADSEPQTLAADLVVDASGRGSRTAQWLAQMGFGEVPVSELKINMRYVSRVYKAPEGFNPDWKVIVVYGQAPDKTLGLVGQVEDGHYIVTMTGKLGTVPPTDEVGFLRYAQNMEQPHIAAFLQHATPVSDFVTHRTPSNLRRNYEKLPAMPDGLVVLGDALCSFNPIFGQGMTTSALDAVTLDAQLEKQFKQQADLSGFSQRYQKAVAKVIDVPWQAATGEDMRHPEAADHVPMAVRLANWYVKQVHNVAAYDRFAHRLFIDTMNMTNPPTVVFQPRMLAKVLWHQIRRKKVQHTVDVVRTPVTISR